MIIGVDRQRQSYLQMNARKEEQKHGKVTYLKLDLNAGSKFAGMKLDETKKICDMSISGGTKLNPLNPSAKVYTEEELEEIRRTKSEEILRKKREEESKTIYVEDVKFTHKELEACKDVAKKAISYFSKTSIGLDYEDYAKIGIAINTVNTYAKKNLNEEQAEVVNNGMEKYFNSLIQAEEKRHKNPEYLIDNREGVGTTGELNKYYALRHKLDKNAAESFKKFVLESHLPEDVAARFIKNLDGAVKNGSLEQSATNIEYAKKIKTLFQNMDIMDEASVKNVFEQYEILMTPAYKALGFQNSYFDTRVTNTIENDVKKFIS